MDDIETILLQFDHEESFGPCSRIRLVQTISPSSAISFDVTDGGYWESMRSRLERFERAQKLGLNPDPEVTLEISFNILHLLSFYREE